MFITYRAHILPLIMSLFLFSSLLYAEGTAVDIATQKQVSLLKHSSIYTSPKDIPLQTIINEKKFKPFRQDYLNLGISKEFIYIHFRVKNTSGKPVTKALILHSPLLESITLYSQDYLDRGESRGIMHLDDAHHTIPYYFTLTLPPQSIKDYYLKIHSSIRTVGFSITMENEEIFLEHDRRLQAIDLILIGFVAALMFYSFFLSYFISDRSYFFYGLYLFMLLYQQASYLGILQLYFPKWFIIFDTNIILMKIGLLLISAALFSIYFLEIKRHHVLLRIYLFIMGIAFLEMLTLDPHDKNTLLTAIFTATIYIFFNLYAGIYVYKKGLKQARLFIVGVGMVSFLYIIMLLDVLGLISLMQYFNPLLLYGTALEAFILSLAFADRYLILQKEKQNVERKALYETKHRAELIEQEVVRKTDELNRALETKEVLMREIHHRVKNNLQLILSIIRLQNLETNNPENKEKLSDLEYRINAIANTYTMLLNNDDLEQIDMEAYIDTLLTDISESYDYRKFKIDIFTDIDAVMPIKVSAYVGLIINELVTNAYKHAFDNGVGSITIKLKQTENHYTLLFEDSGKGFDPTRHNNSLGLKLIHTLVQDQLDGTIEMPSPGHAKYTIRFSL